MVIRSNTTRVLAVALTLALCTLLLCQGLPAVAQEGSGGAPPPPTEPPPPELPPQEGSEGPPPTAPELGR